jgi:hypothetical protein
VRGDPWQREIQRERLLIQNACFESVGESILGQSWNLRAPRQIRKAGAGQSRNPSISACWSLDTNVHLLQHIPWRLKVQGVPTMNAIKAARKLIADAPASEAAKTLARLVLTLESDEAFDLGRLYALDHQAFYLALDVLEEWRIGRHSAGMAKLFYLSCQVHRMSLA